MKSIKYDPLFGARAVIYCAEAGRPGAQEAWENLCKHVDDYTQKQIDAVRADFAEVLDSKARLTREIDVIMNGIGGAAKQASLCDVVSQLRADWPRMVKVSDVIRALDEVALDFAMNPSQRMLMTAIYQRLTGQGR